MKYAFIVNPMSGKGKKAAAFIEKLGEIIANDERDIKYYITEGVGDATVIANRLACEADDAGEDIRIYACGGDGTLNEVANGIALCENAMLGVVPIGSGNDYVRNFDGACFEDILAQLDAEEMRVDIIRYTYDSEEGTVDRYCVNGMNIGFDGNTAIMASELRKYPLIKGSFSYLLAIAINMIKKAGANLKITADGGEIYDGNLLLCSVANGRFCGGGIESCPRARVDNGLLELLIIRGITRRKFVQVFGEFKVGKIFEVPEVDQIGLFAQPEHVTIEPLDGSMQFVVDGEAVRTGKLEIDIMKGAIRMLVPRP